MRWLSVVLVVILGAGCSSTAEPGGRVDRLLVGDGDTLVVYNREPIHLVTGAGIEPAAWGL